MSLICSYLFVSMTSVIPIHIKTRMEHVFPYGSERSIKIEAKNYMTLSPGSIQLEARWHGEAKLLTE